MRPHHETRVQHILPVLENDMLEEAAELAGRRVLGGAAEGSGPVWLGEKAAEGRPLGFFQFLSSGHGEAGAVLFPLGFRDRICGNGSELHQEKFRLDMREHFITRTVVMCRNRSPGEGVDVPSIEETFGQ